MSGEISLGRSPRYPRISLMDAIGHAKRLYDGAHRSVLHTDTAYRVLGYAGKTGASATVLGALRQYGLVRGLRGDVAISDLALRIFEPSSPEEHAIAILEAAETPEAFKAIRNNFGSNVPKSDEPIRSFLIRTLGFSKSGAEDCIRSFRETQAQAEGERVHSSGIVQQTELLDDVRTTASSATAGEGPRASIEDSARLAGFVSARRENTGEFIRVPLAKDCVAELRFEGELSHAAIDRLVSYIQLMRPIWADEAE